ncbi:MAG: hypothetical protein HY881_10340 [Deltaproteobacteria bacterium]|nr:hypothetical protein [Deltaproteobacteria bacterium]
MEKAHAHKLFDLIKVERVNGTDGPARAFTDYVVKLDEANVPNGVSIEKELDVH